MSSASAHGNSETDLTQFPAALSSQYSWQRWTREHGLPDNTVQAILQTRDGYLWVATRAGLGRFDGLKWTVFNRANTSALVSDDCQALAQDSDDTLWIGTHNGLVSFKDGEFHRYDVRDGLNDAHVGMLCPSKRGGLWFATKGVLNRFQAGKLTRTAVADGLAGLIGSLLEDERGTLWIGTAAGVQWLNPADGKLTTNVLRHARAKIVHVLKKDRGGNLWASFMEYHTSNTELVVNQWVCRWAGADRWESLACNPLSNGARPFFAVIDGEDRLWMPSGRGRLVRYFEGASAAFAAPESDSDFYQCGFADREGNLWFGTEKSGLHRLRPRAVRVYSTGDGLPHEQTWTACDAGNGVWIGSDGGASQLKDGRFIHWTEGEGLSRNSMRSIVEDEHGRIWIGRFVSSRFDAGGRQSL
jgi:ligand-binding sensor domain-containing protein